MNWAFEGIRVGCIAFFGLGATEHSSYWGVYFLSEWWAGLERTRSFHAPDTVLVLILGYGKIVASSRCP